MPWPDESSAGESWAKVGHPAIGNLLAALGLLTAIATAAGVLDDSTFWLVIAGVLGTCALFLMTHTLLVRGSEIARLRQAETEFRREAGEAARRIAELEAAVEGARQDWESCEGGYAALRAAVIQGHHGSDDHSFDEELGTALDRLKPR